MRPENRAAPHQRRQFHLEGRRLVRGPLLVIQRRERWQQRRIFHDFDVQLFGEHLYGTGRIAGTCCNARRIRWRRQQRRQFVDLGPVVSLALARRILAKPEGCAQDFFVEMDVTGHLRENSAR